MFLVTLPTNQLLVTPEQLPRLLANISETRYTNERGELLQTTSDHVLLSDATTTTLLIQKPYNAAIEQLAELKEVYTQERDRAEKLQARIQKSKGKSRR